MSSQSSSSCRAVLFDNVDTAKMHGLDTSSGTWQLYVWSGQLYELTLSWFEWDKEKEIKKKKMMM